MSELSTTSYEDNYDRSVPVKVSTNHGPVEGFVHTTDTGVKANVFLGIPFAKPPVGDLRFERPEPPTPWTEPLETKNFKKECVPYITMWLHGGLDTVSEDCLYLNVMAPVDIDNVPPHPVMVYVHGGGFCFGGCVRAGFDKYVKNFVSRGVVVVSIAYRTGVYGFFSTGDSVAEGNNGLFDQVAGLKWVHDNIAKFNGDPNNITLYGQSAGSASVDILSIAPISRDYVHQVIQASGSAGNYWAIHAPTVESSKKLARALGCKSEDSAEIKAFLKKQKYEDIIEITSSEFKTNFVADRNDEKYISFGPRTDNAFFGGKTIDELIAEAPPKPTVFGLMINESAPFILFALTPSKIMKYDKEDVILDIEKVVPESVAGDETEAIRKELIEFYLERNVPSEALSRFYLERHGRLLSDVMFDSAVLQEMEQKLDKKWPVYFYVWNHLNPDVAKATGIRGGFHSYDLMFASDEQVFEFVKLGPIDQKVTEIYAELISNFVKTGNPSLEKLEFPPFTKQDREAFWVDPEPSIRTNVYAEAKEFYDHLEAKYDFSVRHGVKKSSVKSAKL
uniref:COesterase domain-containing protein n=1 Tax=Panagrellus redivivus TaxID=6233 RepID=A0A7E4WB45_PANRE